MRDTLNIQILENVEKIINYFELSNEHLKTH